MRDRAVIFARGPVVLKPRWHRTGRGNLGRPQPLIHHSDCLVMYIFVEVTLISQSRSHPFVTPHRPMMLGDQHLRVRTELLERGIEILRPTIRVAHYGAAKREQIVQRVSRILCHIQDMRLWQVNQHLGRRFRVQSKLKYESYSIDSAGLHRLLNGIVWCDNRSEPARSPRVVLVKAFIDVPPFSNWQRHSKLILPAPCLCVSADNGFSDDGLQEARWRNELRFSGSHLGLRDHATHAAIVVGVTVGVDYSHDRLAWTMRKIEVESFARCSGCTECVDDDETGHTLHDRHIRLRETADLKNAVSDLKQSVCGVELRLTPKTWIYGRRGLVLKKCPAIWIARVGCCRDESPRGVLEVLSVAKRQLRLDSPVGGCDIRFGGLGLLRLCRINNNRYRHEARRPSCSPPVQENRPGRKMPRNSSCHCSSYIWLRCACLPHGRANRTCSLRFEDEKKGGRERTPRTREALVSGASMWLGRTQSR